MGLLLVERLMEDLPEGTTDGKIEEEAAAEGLDKVEVAEAEVAIESEFLQGVVLLSFLSSDHGEVARQGGYKAHLTGPGFVICLAFPTYL